MEHSFRSPATRIKEFIFNRFTGKTMWTASTRDSQWRLVACNATSRKKDETLSMGSFVPSVNDTRNEIDHGRYGEWKKKNRYILYVRESSYFTQSCNRTYLNLGTTFQITRNNDSGEIALLPWPWYSQFKLRSILRSSSAIRTSLHSFELRSWRTSFHVFFLSFSNEGSCLM